MAKFTSYCTAHLRAMLTSLGRIVHHPLASFMTIAVIAISLALPVSFYVLLQNTQSLTNSWHDNSMRIAVYLKPELGENRAQDVVHMLRNNPDISAATYITPSQGLQELGKTLNAENVLQALPNNPLPAVIMVEPIMSLHSTLALNGLLSTLQQLPEVDTVKLDTEWLTRLQAILGLAHRVVALLALLLSIGVLLVVSNTIRLATQEERKEIAVLKLIGATNNFIRRPFLYAGVWYGLFGGIVAWILVEIVLKFLTTPIADLANVYNSNFYLQGIGNQFTVNLLLISMLLGLIGSWLAIKGQLRQC